MTRQETRRRHEKRGDETWQESRGDKIRDDKSRQETRQDESRRVKKRQETRRNETRQDTRNQETRRDEETRHFRNRIFRPSERRRITLRKQYTLDPRLSWILKNNTFRRSKCFRGWQWSQLPCSGGFQMVQDLRDPLIKAIFHHWLTTHYYGGLKSSPPW